MPQTRRRFLATSLLLGSATLAGCGGKALAGKNDGPTLAPQAALPTKVPEGTKIIIGDPTTQKALELTGLVDKLTFEVEFANISGGPQTSEAFRAGALDLGSVADIPPIHAKWTGIETRIVAARFRQDPVNHPIYQLAIAPGISVATTADLQGKKIAFSPGQAQGALLLRVLKAAGLSKEDVELVELPSTEDVYSNSLSSKQVDVAPVGGTQLKRYLAKYGKDGAAAIKHGLRDDPGHLYALKSSIDDPAKAAAIREYVTLWAKALRWIDEHPDEWIRDYYVDDQGLSADDGRYLIEQVGHPDVPDDWGPVIERHQETIDLLSQELGNDGFPAGELYDRRFEKLGHQSFAEGWKA